MADVVTADRPPLMKEALGVLDLLAHSPAHREGEDSRAALATLVGEVVQTHGYPHEAGAIEAAVGQWMEQRDTADLKATGPALPPARPPRLTTWAHSLGRQWRDSPRLRKGLAWSAGALGVVGALAWLPWGTVFQAPFVLAATHGNLTLGLWGLGIGLLWLGMQRAAPVDRDPYFAGLLLALVLGGGGVVANHTSQSLKDAQDIRTQFHAINQALTQAREHLYVPPMVGMPPSTSAVVAEAQKLLKDSPVDLGDFDPSQNTIRRDVRFNPQECAAFSAAPDSLFQVVRVNGQRVGPGPLVCPYHWENEVVFEAKVTTQVPGRP